jgi:feruloyl esterase
VGAQPVASAAPATGSGVTVTLPEHCRVVAVLKPSADSEINIEVLLPSQEWNGKFQAVGNGLWAGTISYSAMVQALVDGYATASTDTGHTGNNAQFAIGHPEKLADFAYRSMHEMTVQAKALLNRYYGQAARLSYYNGCSTGGRQGLMAVQRYPEDFDAVLVGAPANNQSKMHAYDLTVAAPVLRDPAGAIPAAKLTLLNRAAVNACDANDGVKDGVIGDPPACTFDPAALQCKDGDADTCLTAPQVATARRFYNDGRTASGEVFFPRKERGSENEWALFVGNPKVGPGVSIGSFQVAYQDANWDPKSFELERDLKVVDEKVGAIVNATNPDLRAFKARGGKVLMYHGWQDAAISPRNTIDYYTSVQKRMGGRQDDFIRLFMVPGMGHCRGGNGANDINWMAALERWRESKTAPASILATRVSENRVEFTRPLCPYPQVAVYTGTGTTTDAANYACRNR